ncbi:hypothetical protein TNCV_4585091 [Trichonephila clavipes]|nr:hypothetical protein TNCV_4585091 [Trichonephila clavipes]
MAAFESPVRFAFFKIEAAAKRAPTISPYSNEEVSLVTAPVQVQSISPLSSSGRVARFLGGSNRGCAGSEIARVSVESTKKPTPDVVVVSRRDVTALALSYGTFPLRKV